MRSELKFKNIEIPYLLVFRKLQIDFHSKFQFSSVSPHTLYQLF
jgi:hypothetical protein